MKITLEILNNAIENIEMNILHSVEELEILELFDNEDLMLLFDINTEVVRNSAKLKDLNDLKIKLFKKI